MSEKWRSVYFKTNVLLKNIIGKELINDDNVAVMELVKNSYDAGASKVDIIFKNIFNKDETGINDVENIGINEINKLSQIIIKDDGVGMSEDDIVYKWLNIAFSSKKINYNQNNRYQAGNKGVGRFSCDRLGEFLNIYTRKENQKIIHLQINWNDFEVSEIDKEIQEIPLKIREIEDEYFKNETGLNLFEQGTILQIIKLNSVWAVLEEKTLIDIKVQKTKLLKLKNNLERLINPNQSYDETSFKIFIKADDLKENKDDDYHKRVVGEIKNQIFDKLNFKTTFIESYITSDGKKIITELKDKNETIFRLIEKNTKFKLLKDVKIIFYYLNPYAKAYFTKQTGIRSVEFGSIFLFINGFRVTPYGNRDNDSFGLEVRKNQGRSRYFSNREIIGRIEIKDFENKFRVISSREGIVINEAYKELISDFDNKKTKYNGFFYKIIRRLEKYVVDGLSWDSIPDDIDERSLDEMVKKDDWSEEKEKYAISNKLKRYNSSEAIYSILGIKSKDVIDLYINSNLIESLIEEDIEKTNKKLQSFLKNYSNLPINAIDVETNKSINKLIKSMKQNNSISDSLIKDFEKVQENNRIMSRKIKELEVYKKSQQELYKEFQKIKRKEQKIEKELEESRKREELEKEKREKAEEEKLKVEKEIKIVKKEKEKIKREKKDIEEEKKIVENELNTQKKRNIFQKSIIGQDKKHIIGLQHAIGHASGMIGDSVENLLVSIRKNFVFNKETILNLILINSKIIAFENNKIISLSNYITKANFDTTAEEDEFNIVTFIKEYLINIYIGDGEPPTVNIEGVEFSILDKTGDKEFKKEFSPLELTTMIDNFIYNSVKANATQISFLFSNYNENLEIIIKDNGDGIKSEYVDEIFEFGFTTTNGSGIGLSHNKEIVEALGGELYARKVDIGAEFVIEIIKG